MIQGGVSIVPKASCKDKEIFTYLFYDGSGYSVPSY